MAETPWITIVGLGEDGPEGLSPASRSELEKAEVVMGPQRHLDLVPDTGAERIVWPVPFADGFELLRAQEGRRVVVLASGDPFWFGAGTSIAREFPPSAWRALPAPSTFSLIAARMGWPLERTFCAGLHAAPFDRLIPNLAPGLRAIALLRDGEAVVGLMTFLASRGFGQSQLTVFEAIGGSRERITELQADATPDRDFCHPVAVGFEVMGAGAALPAVSGLPDHLFESDGVMTKRAVRAVTLSSLAPRPGELLWDIGAGSGTISIEWMRAHPRCQAIAIEPRPDRVALIRANADRFGLDRLRCLTGSAPQDLTDLPDPDAVFIGGGLSAELLEHLEQQLPAGTRLVANAVTLEAEALLVELHGRKGGELIRIDLSSAAPLGTLRSWRQSYPVVQWSGVL